MNSLKILLFFILPVICSSQIDTDKPIVVSYLITYKHKLDMPQAMSEYSRLVILGDRSLFQSSNEMRRDSIMVHDHENMAALSHYFSNIKYSVEIIGDSITYNESLIKNEYQYNEIIDFDWKINSDEKRMISGYSCTNATTSYGGREWSIWFTKEIPIDSGPYKFKGLPGLILEAQDKSGSYNFKFHKFLDLELGDDINISRYYHSETEENRNFTTREQFNKINLKLNNFSFQEKLDFLMTDENGKSKGRLVSYDVGGSPESQLRDLNSEADKNKMKANPIEIGF